MIPEIQLIGFGIGMWLVIITLVEIAGNVIHKIIKEWREACNG